MELRFVREKWAPDVIESRGQGEWTRKSSLKRKLDKVLCIRRAVFNREQLRITSLKVNQPFKWRRTSAASKSDSSSTFLFQWRCTWLAFFLAHWCNSDSVDFGLSSGRSVSTDEEESGCDIPACQSVDNHCRIDSIRYGDDIPRIY